ncbi:hypothetical protein [Micrococcus terreus]|uniref:Methyltransferase domain-containing protein n=1 Tax=Micrococcus terreus TaxID=574650 RepID=A0A1I7MJ09_9MICC|nr:hypothetical protein [Micrococcus terreus]SFV21921.1 hypothetical protein SAMN04487966_103112 [Micrococcus terreus]
MTGAAPDWLEARAPFDDAAREQSLPLLESAAHTLLESTDPGDTVTVVDLGAGTGKSAAWFRRHLTPLLPDRQIAWHLVDGHAPSLELAGEAFPDAGRLLSMMSDLPAALGEHLEETSGRPAPGSLLLTCSAVLDVLTQADVDAVLDTLTRCRGLGLFLLSITEHWHLDPADPRDEQLAQAFTDHQRWGDKLGAHGGQTMAQSARQRGITVETSESPWRLHAPQDAEFIQRFLAERVAAVVEAEPDLQRVAADWLGLRTRQAGGDEGLAVTVDHVDVLLNAR